MHWDHIPIDMYTAVNNVGIMLGLSAVGHHNSPSVVEADWPPQEERPSPPLQLQERQGQRLVDYLRPRTVEADAQLAVAAGVAGAPSGAVGGSGLARQLVRQQNRAMRPHAHPVHVRANGLASPTDL